MFVSSIQEKLETNIKTLQLNFTQLLTSDDYYRTPEISTHIKHVNNALDNIKLDREFQRGSKNWIKQFDANEMKSNETNIRELIIQGTELAQQLNVRLNVNEMKKKEVNQMRETYNWACDLLLEYLQALRPYASSSYARLDNIAHHLGVTDRFVGYRNNLTRFGNQSTNANTIWADHKLPTASTPDWRDWTHAFQHPGLSTTPSLRPPSVKDNRNVFSSMAITQPTEIPRTSAPRKIASRSFSYTNDYNTQMNRAGISVNYPGASETVDRFEKPKGSSQSPSLAVAQPDFSSIGRPFAQLVSKSSCSEYIDRYTYPDSSKIARYPWLRP